MSRPTPPYADESWGWGKESAAGHRHHPVRRVALLRVAVGAHGQEVPPADRGRVGIRGPRGHDDGVLVRRRPGHHRRLRVVQGQRRRTAARRRRQEAERVGPLRHPRQRRRVDRRQVRRRLLRAVAPGGSEGRQRQGALSLRRARRILGRCAGEIEERGAAIVDRGVEPPGSAESEEHVVAHGRDLRRLPRRRRVGQFVEVRVGCQTTPECTAGTIPWSALWTSEISRHPPRRGATSSRHPRPSWAARWPPAW